MTRRRQWRLVAAATKRHRLVLEGRRGFIAALFLALVGVLEKIVTIGGWTVKDVYQATARRPVPPRQIPVSASMTAPSLQGSGRLELKGRASLTV